MHVQRFLVHEGLAFAAKPLTHGGADRFAQHLGLIASHEDDLGVAVIVNEFRQERGHKIDSFVSRRRGEGTIEYLKTALARGRHRTEFGAVMVNGRRPKSLSKIFSTPQCQVDRVVFGWDPERFRLQACRVCRSCSGVRDASGRCTSFVR